MSLSPEIEQMLAVIDALPDPVFILTESGRYAGIVGGKDTRFYHDGSGLVGHTLHEVLPKDKADWFLKRIRHALDEQGLQTVEYALGGEEVDGLDTEQGPAGMLWFEGRIQPLSSLYEGERAVVWVARNITQRYQLESRLRDLSEHDELTGIDNRRKLISELKNRFNEYQRYEISTSLLMIDIDHFKMINDEFGHLVGDDILIQVAKVSKLQLRDSDHLARFGGEEFAAILPQASLADAELVAERLRTCIPQLVKHPAGNKANVTVSIGISQLEKDDENEDSIIRRADEALYRAKRAGRDCVVIYSKSNAE